MNKFKKLFEAKNTNIIQKIENAIPLAFKKLKIKGIKISDLEISSDSDSVDIGITDAFQSIEDFGSFSRKKILKSAKTNALKGAKKYFNDDKFWSWIPDVNRSDYEDYNDLARDIFSAYEDYFTNEGSININFSVKNNKISYNTDVDNLGGTNMGAFEGLKDTVSEYEDFMWLMSDLIKQPTEDFVKEVIKLSK